MCLMENIAKEMTESLDGHIVLLEDIDSGKIELAAKAIWPEGK